MVSNNVPTSRHHGAPKHGDALLAGLVRCRRCGRKLTVRYTGAKHNIPRYSCYRGQLDNGEPRCIAFGGLRVDDAIEEALLQVVGPGAIEAAIQAQGEAAERRDRVRETLVRDLEAARYATARAFRQYDATDPANRLVAGELEARWNAALARQADIEAKIAGHDALAVPRQTAMPVSFATLADNLQAVWTAPTTDARLKKRIVRTLIHEVIADIDADASQIVLIIHWIGGVHTELRLPRRRRGQRNSTPPDIVKAVKQLALIANDDIIAGILNRNGLLTGNGNRWNRERVCALRSHRRSIADRIRSTVPHRTASNPGSILPDHPPFSTLHPKRSDWRPLRARSKRSIRLPMARGSSNAPFLSDRMRKTWRNEAENDKITPRDHVPISKTYLLQQHRQMGVVKQDCRSRSTRR